jgi:hypothetical protein
MSQPWQALEQLDDVATSHLSWRLMLGDAFESHRELLVPIKDLAASLPVPGHVNESLEIIQVGVSSKATTTRQRSMCPSIGVTSSATNLASVD